MNKELENKLQLLTVQANLSDNNEPYLEMGETLLKKELKKNLKDTELWLRLAMLEFTSPWEDYERISEYLHNIFEYDAYNAEAVLIIAYMQDLFRGGVFDETRDRLLNIKNEDHDIMGMTELALAWYFRDHDVHLYENHLKKSIEYAPQFLQNYFELGMLYLSHYKDREKGHLFVQQGLENLIGIYGINVHKKDDFTDLQDFFDEYYRRTHLTKPNLEDVKEWLEL